MTGAGPSHCEDYDRPPLRILTPSFCALLAAHVIQQVGINLVYTSIALVVVDRLHLGPVVAGFVVALLFLTSLIARVPAGSAIDLRGPKVLGLAGSVVCVAGSLLLASLAASSLEQDWVMSAMGTGVLLFGVGYSLVTTSLNARLGSTVPPRRRGEAVGYFGIGYAVGTALGAGTSFTFYAHVGPFAPFAVASLLFVVGLVPWLASGSAQSRPRVSRRVGLERRVLVPAIGMYCLVVAQGASTAFLPVVGVDRGIENPNLFFVASAITALLSRTVTGPLSDARGRFWLIGPGYLAHAIGLLIAGVATTTEILVVAGAFVGLGFGAAQSGLQTLAIDLAPVGRLGAASATLFAAMDLAVLSGTAMAGIVVAQVGYAGLLPALSTAPIVGFLILAAWTRTRRHKVEAGGSVT